MKKQFLLFYFLLISVLAIAQVVRIKTELPCKDEMLLNIKGRWIKTADVGSSNNSEVIKQLNAIHSLVLNIIPEPKGVDAAWHRSSGISYFGEKRKYFKTADERDTYDSYNLPNFNSFYYKAGFFRYRCEYGKTNIILSGYPGETGTWLQISANCNMGVDVNDDTWTIDDHPVMVFYPAKERKEGIEFTYSEPGAHSRQILIHRKGELPYKYVSRKQYLDHCITRFTKMYDGLIKGFEQAPVRSLEEQEREKQATIDKFRKQFANDPQKLKANVDYYLSGYKTDQQIRDERIIESKNHKEQELKKWNDELEKSASEGLLETPAMVIANFYPDNIFTTDSANGHVFVIENSGYLRKDLPKYVPQFFFVTWNCNDWEGQKKIGEIMDSKFPFEKLQAMIR